MVSFFLEVGVGREWERGTGKEDGRREGKCWKMGGKTDEKVE